jgi:hypothetical protein
MSDDGYETLDLRVEGLPREGDPSTGAAWTEVPGA